MKLGKTEIGPVVTASGVQGYGGQGYWYHKWIRPFGLDFRGATDIEKTTTIEAQLDPANSKGIMPMRKDGITPSELVPRCIWFDWNKGITLNAVGLSGPGFVSILGRGLNSWRTQPWIMSFMAISQTPQQRLEERREFLRLMLQAAPHLPFLAGVEENFSCPNVGIDPAILINEVEMSLELLANLRLPHGVKLNQTVPPQAVKRIADHRLCAFIGGYNTYPFNKIPQNIKASCLPDGTSPLTKRNIPQPGGGSGRAFFQASLEWHVAVREAGVTKAMIGGLGVHDPHSAIMMNEIVNCPGAEPSAIAIGSMVFMAPTQVRPTIHALQAREEKRKWNA